MCCNLSDLRCKMHKFSNNEMPTCMLEPLCRGKHRDLAVIAWSSLHLLLDAVVRFYLQDVAM